MSEIYGKDWEYRVLDDEGIYRFIVVQLDQNGEPINDYDNFHSPVGNSIKDIELELERLAEALNKPVLIEGDTNVEIS